MNNDTLKYWPIVRYYYKRKYDLKGAELDLILFLRSEGRFGAEKFAYFNQTFTWDKGRFQGLVRKGWIENFRKRLHGGNRGPKRKAIYQLSKKAKIMCTKIYKALEGESELSESPYSNPIFKPDGLSFKDKVYRNAIIEMNQKNREIRRQKRKDGITRRLLQ